MANGYQQNQPSPGRAPRRAVGSEPQPVGSDKSSEANEHHEYRNKAVINQRGATLEINNSTDREELKLSQYSGSNIALNNLVNSELASNNKQTKVVNDKFESVGNDRNVYVGKDKVERVVENTYILRGFENDDQLIAAENWKGTYTGIARDNSQFRIQRGGSSFPNGVVTPLIYEQNPNFINNPAPWAGPNDQQQQQLPQEVIGRAPNPTLNQYRWSVNNIFGGFGKPAQPNADPPENQRCAPAVKKGVDEVKDFEFVRPGLRVGPRRNRVDELSVLGGSGGVGGDANFENPYGSRNRGVMTFGPNWSASTEGGRWNPTPNFTLIPGDPNGFTQQQQAIVNIQNTLNNYELDMGNGGDEIDFVKRHKIETIGAATNDYPSIRVDEFGRSQPVGVDVGRYTTYVNMDTIPHVEQVNNDMTFPVGNYTLNVGNRYNMLVGSGGVQLKTSGAVEIGGTTANLAANKVTVQGCSGVHIGSESVVEIQSKKSISLRSDRQVLISPSLGIQNDLKVGGASYVEGEAYVQHVTAPIEVQETHATELFGKFNTDCPRELQIGEAAIDMVKFANQLNFILDEPLQVNQSHGEGEVICYYPVFALKEDDLIKTYPHSHNFNNLPLRLCQGNEDVRKFAMCEGINVDASQTRALPIVDEKKDPWRTTGPTGEIGENNEIIYPCKPTRVPSLSCEPPEPPTCPDIPDCSGETQSEPTVPITSSVEALNKQEEQIRRQESARMKLNPGNPDFINFDDVLEARKERACARACRKPPVELFDGDAQQFPDIANALIARDGGDCGQQLQQVCGCGGGNGPDGNPCPIEPGRVPDQNFPNEAFKNKEGGWEPGKAKEIDNDLGLLEDGDFEFVDADGNTQTGMDGLRLKWDSINRQRQADNKPLINFPEISNPDAGGENIAAGPWGPNAPENPLVDAGIGRVN